MTRLVLVAGLVAACGPAPSSEVGYHVVLEPGSSPRLARFDLPGMDEGGKVESVWLEVLRPGPGPELKVTVLAGPFPPDPELVSSIDLSRAAPGVGFQGIGRVELLAAVVERTPVRRTLFPFLRDAGGVYRWEGLPIFVSVWESGAGQTRLQVGIVAQVACGACARGPVNGAPWEIAP